MGSAVIGAVSLICVVGLVIGVVAVISNNGDKNANLTSTQKSVSALCEPAMYQKTCVKTLNAAAHNESSSTEDIIKNGARVALQAFIKVFNLTETFKPKGNGTKKEQGTKMAVDDCKDLYESSIAKLQRALDNAGNKDTYKDGSLTWDLRLWLSDVLTYQEDCRDGLGNVNATSFESKMSGSAKNATQITMSILDVVTYFTEVLTEVGFEVDTDKVFHLLKNGSINGKTGGRRLLGGPTAMLGSDDLPRWMSKADRRLMGLDGINEDRQGRVLDGVTPNAVVAKDGSGQYKTIQEALKAFDPKAPLPAGGKYVIHVKEGTYDEFIVMDGKMANIFMYGDGPTKSVVTGKKCFEPSRTTTSQTASFAVQGAGFFCKDMGFENTAGPEGHQAVALRANGEKQVFHNCAFNGYQDTLYVQGGSQFFRDCTITGTIDFIFGNGATIFQKCTIIVRQPLPNQFNAVTAQGRTGFSMPTGIVIQDCKIQADPALDKQKIKTFLGRPWKAYARTVFMESEIGDMITPEGYREWEETPNTKDSIWGEYANTGPGSDTKQRVKWPHVKTLSAVEAEKFTGNLFLPDAEAWLKPSGIPYYLGFKT